MMDGMTCTYTGRAKGKECKVLGGVGIQRFGEGGVEEKENKT